MNEAIDGYVPLEHLKEIRHDFSDEIPKEIIHSDAVDNKFKVRRNWFVGILVDVENALKDGVIMTLEGKLAAEQLVKRFRSDEFIERELTEKRDIDEANNLIDIILVQENI